MLFALLAATVLLLPRVALGCSNFLMDTSSGYCLSGRTMDLSGGLDFGITSVPRGDDRLYGYVGFEAEEGDLHLQRVITAGLNERGVSCDMQTLLHSKYSEPSSEGINIMQLYFCHYVLSKMQSVDELKTAMGKVTVFGPTFPANHFVVRDAKGCSLVLEWLDGELFMHEDLNDDKTGFGIMTNEPRFEYHVQNIQHLQWKRGLTRQAVTIPGTWYPEDRFMRIYMVKSAMSSPRTFNEAMQQAVATLNTVTVPMGQQYGTDSGATSGEGSGDHTLWGIIYDHADPAIYWRTVLNPSLQRLRLKDVPLGPGATSHRLPVTNDLPWFNDRSSAFLSK